MARFVHLAPEAAARKIVRSGIRRNRTRYGMSAVYASPVLPSFFATHQWLRELKRRGQRTIVGVYFKIPNEEIVSVGHYGGTHHMMPAAEASDLIRNVEDPRGYEVLIPRKIDAREIQKVRTLPQVVGWRYLPNAHGRRPCPCPFCLRRGEFKGAAIRRRLG